VTQEAEERRYAAAPLPAPVSDMYGAGDSFAAGLTYGLGAALPLQETLELAARCAALALTRRGAYGGPLAP
jgi:ribokinase